MIYFIFALLIVAVDRLVKYWITSSLWVGQAIEFIPGVLRITHVENTGAAFSIFSDMRWPLVAVSAIASVILIFVVLRYRDGEIGRLAASFMLGGAVGNLIDRVLTGKVVDMFEPVFINFAVFNVADVFVTVGCLIFVGHLIHLLIQEQKKKKKPDDSDPAQDRHVQLPPEVKNSGQSGVTPEDKAIAESAKLTEHQILMEYFMEQEVDDER